MDRLLPAAEIAEHCLVATGTGHALDALARRAERLLGPPARRSEGAAVWAPEWRIASDGDGWSVWLGSRGGWTAEGTPVRSWTEGAVPVPPAAAAAVNEVGIAAHTDALGMGPVFVWQGTDVSALGTSSTVLGAAAGAPLDPLSATIAALLGYPAFADTSLLGVHKLAPGASAHFGRGSLTTEAAPADKSPSVEVMPADRVGPAGADAVRAAVAAALAANRAPAIELSGGLDSRLVLAGIPATSRPDVTVLTVGDPGEPNYEIARSIARQLGLEHVTASRVGLATLDPDDALRRVSAAAARRDWAGNPLAWAVNDWVEEQLPQGPRLTGQGAEVAQGVYYRGERPASSIEPAAVERLVTWRLLTNHPVHERLFDAELATQARAHLVAAVGTFLRRTGEAWLPATDELYLGLRMQRWAGAELAAAGSRRAVLAPFLHPAHLSWARSVPVEMRRNRRAAAAALEALDPILAGLPLDRGGLTPIQLAGSSARTRLAVGADLGRRGVRKTLQRLSRRGRHAAAAGMVLDATRRAVVADPAVFDRVAELDWVSTELVHEVQQGRLVPDEATLGVLLNLAGALECLAAAR